MKENTPKRRESLRVEASNSDLSDEGVLLGEEKGREKTGGLRARNFLKWHLRRGWVCLVRGGTDCPISCEGWSMSECFLRSHDVA